MGTVTGRLRVTLVALLALALLVPTAGHAATVTYVTPFIQGPQGGDSANHFINVDPDTGQMTILRVQAAGISGNLGCGGQGGYSYFKVAHAGTGVTSVMASFTESLIDPYTFVSIAVRQGANFLGTNSIRGPILGDGSITLDLESPSTAPIEVWFGIQVTSACPNIDGGTAKFTSVAVTSA